MISGCGPCASFMDQFVFRGMPSRKVATPIHRQDEICPLVKMLDSKLSRVDSTWPANQDCQPRYQ